MPDTTPETLNYMIAGYAVFWTLLLRSCSACGRVCATWRATPECSSSLRTTRRGVSSGANAVHSPAARPAARPLTALERFSTFVHAVAFVLGLAPIFVLLFGLPLYAVGRFLGEYKPLLALLGGIVVIIFGLATMGVLNISWLNSGTHARWASQRDWGYLASYLMGVFFAAGWSPCIGSTLGAILTMGYGKETAAGQSLVAGRVSSGSGMPFLLVGLGVDRAARRPCCAASSATCRLFKIVTGLLLIRRRAAGLGGRAPGRRCWSIGSMAGTEYRHYAAGLGAVAEHALDWSISKRLVY